MDELALAWPYEDGWRSDDPEPEAKRVPDPFHDVERRVRGPCFDRGEVARGEPDSERQLALAERECRPSRSTEPTERYPERWHRRSRPHASRPRLARGFTRSYRATRDQIAWLGAQIEPMVSVRTSSPARSFAIVC